MQAEKIGKYELLERLGRGTSADVYLAKDTRMGRQVALKVVEPETADLEPFFKEARLLARLQHPNIVTIHSSDLIDGKVVVDRSWSREKRYGICSKTRNSFRWTAPSKSLPKS